MPSWPVTNDPACGLYVGGLALPQVMILVMYYHPIWSFVVPCLVVERLMAAPSDRGTRFAAPTALLPRTRARLDRCWARCGACCTAGECGARRLCTWLCAVLLGVAVVVAVLGVMSRFGSEGKRLAAYVVLGVALLILGALLFALAYGRGLGSSHRQTLPFR